MIVAAQEAPWRIQGAVLLTLALFVVYSNSEKGVAYSRAAPTDAPTVHDMSLDAYDSYLEAFRSCYYHGWKNVTKPGYREFFRVPHAPLPPNEVHDLRDQLGVHTCTHDGWLLVKLGPVTSTGDTLDDINYSFDPSDLLGLDSMDQYIGVDKYAIGRAYTDGHFARYPPLGNWYGGTSRSILVTPSRGLPAAALRFCRRPERGRRRRRRALAVARCLPWTQI